MNANTPSAQDLAAAIADFKSNFTRVETEVARVIVGQREVVQRTLAAIFAGGHVLLEGVPGLGKTLLVKSIANTLGLVFKRIQFTPDLMPSDVTGTQILTEDDSGKRRFVFKQGPLFANVVLADEINRATPKTQAALLEAMEERQITVLNETHALPKPFFVLATQNPVELEGTYPLPEAQLDRFMMKLIVPSPTSLELKEILGRTTGTIVPEARPMFANHEILSAMERMRALVRHVLVAEPIQDMLVRMVAELTPSSEHARPNVKRYVRFGPGPRGAQAIMLSAKVAALLDSRINLAFEDLQSVLLPCLRHRLILNFEAEADGVTGDKIIEELRGRR